VHVDFVAEITSPNEDEKTTTCTIIVDGFSNSNSSGTWVIIENKDGLIVKVSLGLFFTMTNNTTEYEAFLEYLRLDKDMGANITSRFEDQTSLHFCRVSSNQRAR